MYISKIREDGVFDGLIEVPDGTAVIPMGHSFSIPPKIPTGKHAIMSGGWKVIDGEKPIWPPEPSPEEVQKRLYEEIVNQTQKRLDDFAKTKDYDNILSACSYATSMNEKYGVEGRYCLLIREQTWDKLYQILGEVQGGTRSMPAGYMEIESELPVLIWPN